MRNFAIPIRPHDSEGRSSVFYSLTPDDGQSFPFAAEVYSKKAQIILSLFRSGLAKQQQDYLYASITIYKILIIFPFSLYLLCKFKNPWLIVMLRNVSLEFCPVLIDIAVSGPAKVIVKLQYGPGSQVVNKFYIHMAFTVYREQDIRSSEASEDNLIIIEILAQLLHQFQKSLLIFTE